ncbi:MAG: energy-coupling factor transporter transmembrane component T [Tissierellia bacterium]|nr:energy-coupling factor transporter transmembrane component T [Tissierellia bacterium]
MGDFFNEYHPVVNAVFFISILFMAMFTNYPVLQIISILGALIYLIILKGFSGAKGILFGSLIMFFMVTLLNPIFNHKGVTILTYFKNGNPLTLESMVYGMSAGFMFISVILWFSCHNVIMTSDRLMYLFGRLAPALSLIFSMSLRFVPLYKKRIDEITLARSGIGMNPKNGNLWNRMKSALAIFSIFVTWALESSIETADSMRSRGYGLKGRKAFSLFHFRKRDGILLTFIVFIDFLLLYLMKDRVFKIVFYPAIKIAKVRLETILGILAFAFLAFLPTGISIWEEWRWEYYN